MNELYHYGIPRRSGRYPWGSGKVPYQSAKGNKEKEYRIYRKWRSANERQTDKAARSQSRAEDKYQKAVDKFTKAQNKMYESLSRRVERDEEVDRLITEGRDAFNEARIRFGDRKMKEIIAHGSFRDRVAQELNAAWHIWRMAAGKESVPIAVV